MIKLDNVSYSYKVGEPLLSDISFEVRKGEKVSIIGPGGCGKSTILKLISGLIPPVKGSVSLFDEDINELSKAERNEMLK